MFLKEKRDEEAEKVARASVRTLENSEMQLLLVEALTTHGAALARLRKYGSALTALRRAVDVSQVIGSVNLAEQAALTAFREMGEHLAAQEKEGLVSGRSLKEEILSVERHLIKHALEANEGSVTRAAKTLGISYQELHYMLQTRHRDLAHLRLPVRRRPRRD